MIHLLGIKSVLCRIACIVSISLLSGSAGAWGDEGHEVIGLIAEHYLEPAVRARVESILAGDTTQLTSRDIAHEATWADKYRDSDRDGAQTHYFQSRNWHFINLELDGPSVNAACYGRPRLTPGGSASRGPANDCLLDKIYEFTAELRSPSTGAEERRLALQFVLHFIGDLHQPLHASDDHDQGGNGKRALVQGARWNTLHHEWDKTFVARLGRNENEIARQLIACITPAQRARWSTGRPDDWAEESFLVAKAHAYGRLPAPRSAFQYRLSAAYVEDATAVTAEQLSKAGVRLALVLNLALQ